MILGVYYLDKVLSPYSHEENIREAEELKEIENDFLDSFKDSFNKPIDKSEEIKKDY